MPTTTSIAEPGDNEVSQHQYAWLCGPPPEVLSRPGATEKKVYMQTESNGGLCQESVSEDAGTEELKILALKGW